MAHKHMKIGSTLLFKCKLKPQCDTTKYVLECKKKKKPKKRSAENVEQLKENKVWKLFIKVNIYYILWPNNFLPKRNKNLYLYNCCV